MDKQDLIDGFLNNSLSEKELIEFNELLINDKAFKATYELEKDLKKVIIELKKDTLRLDLERFEQKPKISRFNWYILAACIFIGLIALPFILKSNPISNDELFVMYFEPHRNTVAPLERGDNSGTEKELAFSLYDNKKYADAVLAFENGFQNSNNSYYLFYAANSYLKLDKTNDAIRLLHKHKTFKDNYSIYDDWYLALSYLKTDEIEKSRELLKRIVVEKAYDYKAAEKLLEKME
jgi:tetratricopeptide (TPR) repeat protein